MEKPYHIVCKESSEGLGRYLAKNGQVLLPMVELIEQSKMALDELIDVLGRAQIEAGLRLSAEGGAGPPHPGKKGETVGVSRASVSREASEEELRRLGERGLQALDLLIIYLDGVIFGDHHVLVAVGVDAEGHKHVRGVAEGASENQVVAKGLLEDVVRRGVRTDRKYLLVVDGSRALRAAIDAVLGADNPVPRCRHHKLENVRGYLPEHLKDQTQAAMRSAFRLPAREGMVRLEKQAEWLEREYPSAATSLREGLAEMFTVNRLGLSPSLARCLVSIPPCGMIESPHSGVRLRPRRVCRWRDGRMVLRWAAAALLMTEQNFRRIMGYRDRWMLKAALDQKGVLVQQEVA